MASRNVEYWNEYWKSLFSGEEHDRFGFSLMSPRVVLKELSDEVGRHLKNIDNKKFLFAKLKFYVEFDPPSKECLYPVMKLLGREFDSPRLEIISQLCRSGLDELDKFGYYDQTVNYLKDLLRKETPVSHGELRNPCQNLIVELLECGYSESYIKKIPSRLFAEVQMIERIAHTDFPYETAGPADWSDDDLVLDFNRRLTEEMNGQTEASRLEALKKYPRIPKKNCTFIFQVKGIRGDESFNLGGVKFYSPEKERILKNRKGENFEPEMFSKGEEHYFNAAVPASCVDFHAGAANARRKLHNALNSLRFGLDGESHYEIGNSYVVGDENNRYCAGSHSADNRHGRYHWNRSIKITKQVREDILESSLFSYFLPKVAEGADIAGSMASRFQNSLHWFRKGSEAEAPEDKLLSFWISIENLLGAGLAADRSSLLGRKGDDKVISLAFEVLPRLRCLSNVYQRGWLLHGAVSNVFLNLPRERRADVWRDLVDRAGFGPGPGVLYLDKFVDCVPEIIDFLGDSVLCDNLREVYDFYHKPGVAASVIAAEFERFRSDVVLLYRMRNKIVHNAHVSDSLLPYYIRSAKEFSIELIKKGMIKCFRNGADTPEAMIAAIYLDYDLILTAIDRSGAAKVLFTERWGDI